MWHKLPEDKKKDFLQRWIEKITRDETDLTLKKHIVKHAHEIYVKDKKKWSHSMRNLLDIFDAKYDIEEDVGYRIDRLHNKYRKNKRRYTAPPEI